MPGLLSDEKDILFTLFDLLNIERLFQLDRYSGWNEKAVRMLLVEARRLAENKLMPLNREGDRIGAKFDKGQVFSVPGTVKAYRAFADGGWLTPCEDESLGGQGLPRVINYAAHELFLSANFPFMCYANLSHDAGKLIEKFGTEEQKKLYLAKLYEGQWMGTMAITESNAGSDVGAIETEAVRISEEGFAIKGQKIFITNGEHDSADNIVHMVLARIENDPPGAKGLSLFIVPKYRVDGDGSLGEANDVRCIGIEEKMGLHGSPTTTLLFGEQNACTGQLLGKAREGIQTMFHMINASRLEVGFWGLGAASAAYQHALGHASSRKQGKAPSPAHPDGPVEIIEHPDIKRTLLFMKSHIDGMRSLLYFCGQAMDRRENSQTDAGKNKWRSIIELLTPICKAYTTEKAVEIASQAIQVHGGYGYLREYPVEQLLRDIRIACIFEGTTAIQAIDFTLRKACRKDGVLLSQLLQELQQDVKPADKVNELRPYADQLRKSSRGLSNIPIRFSEEMTRRPFYPLLKATPFLEAAGDVLIGNFLLKNAIVAHEKLNTLCIQKRISDTEDFSRLIRHSKPAAHLAGKIESAKFFIGNCLPITDGKIAALQWGDISAWDISRQSF